MPLLRFIQIKSNKVLSTTKAKKEGKEEKENYNNCNQFSKAAAISGLVQWESKDTGRFLFSFFHFCCFFFLFIFVPICRHRSLVKSRLQEDVLSLRVPCEWMGRCQMGMRCSFCTVARKSKLSIAIIKLY
jgi:hypothetical protein